MNSVGVRSYKTCKFSRQYLSKETKLIYFQFKNKQNVIVAQALYCNYHCVIPENIHTLPTDGPSEFKTKFTAAYRNKCNV